MKKQISNIRKRNLRFDAVRDDFVPEYIPKCDWIVPLPKKTYDQYTLIRLDLLKRFKQAVISVILRNREKAF